MKHAKHSKPLRVAQIALVLLAALAAASVAGAAGQAGTQTGGQSRPAQVTPVPAGPSYGPVLHPQPLKSEPGAQPEQTPQAQEEKSGAAPPGRAPEVDPSARPAPQPKDPAKSDSGKDVRKDVKKDLKRSARRSSPQRVDIVPPAASTSPLLAPLPPPQPLALKPGPAQITACNGGVCTDAGGATYNTGVGNAAVSSQGRLCTRSGNTMQCF